MEYKPLTFPLSPEVAADLCDPGSPPEGHVRVVIFRFPGKSGNELVLRAQSNTVKCLNLTVDFDEDEDIDERPTSYRIGFCMPEILGLLQDWEP